MSYPVHYLHNILMRTTDLHGAFHGKTVFIAGDSGFYGSWYKAYFTYLREQGVDVEVQGGSRRSGWDILDTDTYTGFQNQADYIIHAAGSAGQLDRKDLGISPHELGTTRMRIRAKPGTTLLYISSGSIADPYDESKIPYARAKGWAEQSLKRHPSIDRPYQIVRPFATVGPGMNLNAHFAISTFIRRALVREPLSISTTPCSRSFCHVADLIVQCLHVMVNGDGQPYEVGSDDVITVEQAARLISSDVRMSDEPFATNAASSSYSADLTRIRKQFNLALDWNSERAILDTWNHYRDLKP